MRLDKFLSSQNIGSRKQVHEIIRKGRVTVNGVVEKTAQAKIVEESDAVYVDGVRIEYRKFVYIMMNKPQGVLSATEDKKQKTVLDILPPELYRKDLFVAGRLDKDTEGFLVLTNDGDFAHRLMSPRKKVYKKYYARLNEAVTPEIIERMEKGIVLPDGTECLPAKITEADEKDAVFISICEGKFHQVKRMFAACGTEVVYLKRTAIGELFLDEKLNLGEARYISNKELLYIFVQTA